MVSRRSLLLIAAVLLLTACSSDSAAPATTAAPAATTASGLTQVAALPIGASGTECRNALTAIDAYVLAKQAGGTNDAAAAAARTRCLASSEVPPSCSDAMRISVTIGQLSFDKPEFVSAYTSYGEASTMCRLKLLKSI